MLARSEGNCNNGTPNFAHRNSVLIPAALAPSSTLRAFSLVECIARAESPLTLDELTQLSGLPKPTVFRILGLLVRGGLVARDAIAKRYVVGPRLAAIAWQAQMHSPARAWRHAILVRLVEEIGETCNFTLLDGDEVVYLDRVETSSPVRLHMDAGSRVPLHCTASGKLFLAQMTPAQRRRVLGAGPFKRYTERTITTAQALEKALRRVRAEGIGTDVGEYLEGSVCLAVPVTDRGGHICAGLALHGPAPRMTLRKGMEHLSALRRAASALADTVAANDDGGRRGPTPARVAF